jgi:hypothetical protein
MLLYGADTPNQLVLGMNSWGPFWGQNGTFKMTFSDLSALLDHGEACAPTEVAYAPLNGDEEPSPPSESEPTPLEEVDPDESEPDAELELVLPEESPDPDVRT